MARNTQFPNPCPFCDRTSAHERWCRYRGSRARSPSLPPRRHDNREVNHIAWSLSGLVARPPRGLQHTTGAQGVMRNHITWVDLRGML